ncbi:MAG: alpha/beta fold hydrolase [Pyrinomonadaceae bacterium]
MLKITVKRWLTACLITLALVLLAEAQSLSKAQAIRGQHAHRLKRRISRTVGAQYLLFLPEEYGRDRHRRWPLIMYLHGGSRRGNDIEKVREYGLPALVEKDRSFPFIVVSPQCPEGEIWTDTETLIAILDEVSKHYAVDVSRVYLTGHSMGGRGTWYLAYKHPERFAAIAPMSGGPVIETWAARLKEMPVWVFHGAKDDLVPLSESETMVKALQALGNRRVKLTVYPDRDHFILDTYENMELYTWFSQHQKLLDQK